MTTVWSLYPQRMLQQLPKMTGTLFLRLKEGGHYGSFTEALGAIDMYRNKT